MRFFRYADRPNIYTKSENEKLKEILFGVVYHLLKFVFKQARDRLFNNKFRTLRLVEEFKLRDVLFERSRC